VSKTAQEKTFENKIKKYLKDHNCWHVKYFANMFTKSGIPDILACVNGYFVAIEVKAEKGEPSELQLWNQNKIRESGGIDIILYPSQWEDFKLLINDLINRPEHLDWSEQKQFDRR
jgi:hypothetical protein